jgi:hypothetical protein
LPRTEAEQRSAGDARRSIESRYADKHAYRAAAAKAADTLVAAGVLLPEDVSRVLARAGAHWDWIMGR